MSPALGLVDWVSVFVLWFGLTRPCRADGLHSCRRFDQKVKENLLVPEIVMTAKPAGRVKFGSDQGFLSVIRGRVDEYFRSTGRRKRDCPQMYLKSAIFLSWLSASYVLLVFVAQTWWQALPLAVALGLAMGAIGLNVQHDAAHHAISRYGDICARKHGGNAESVAAYEATKANIGRDRERIVTHIRAQGSYGATRDEIAQETGIPYPTVCGRCAELQRDGIVRKSGVRRETRTGAKAMVLVL
jgi:hypothetical protein